MVALTETEIQIFRAIFFFFFLPCLGHVEVPSPEVENCTTDVKVMDP